jgi:hypothetical protein
VTGLDTLENAYRLRLGWALPTARTRAGEADDPFVVTRRAMEARAWDGGQSDAFSQECAAKGSAAGGAADECVSALEVRYRAEPVRVSRLDRRAHFS